VVTGSREQGDVKNSSLTEIKILNDQFNRYMLRSTHGIVT